MIAWAAMGDANASIPTPQPVLPRPMFGAYPAAAGGDVGALRRAGGARRRPGRPARRAAAAGAGARHPPRWPRRDMAEQRRAAADRGRPRHVHRPHRRRAGRGGARRPSCRWPSATSCSDEPPYRLAAARRRAAARPGGHAHSGGLEAGRRDRGAVCDARDDLRGCSAGGCCRPRPGRGRACGRCARAAGRPGSSPGRCCARTSCGRARDPARARRRRATSRPPTAQGRARCCRTPRPASGRRPHPVTPRAALPSAPHQPLRARVAAAPRRASARRDDRRAGGVHALDRRRLHGRRPAARASTRSARRRASLAWRRIVDRPRAPRPPRGRAPLRSPRRRRPGPCLPADGTPAGSTSCAAASDRSHGGDSLHVDDLTRRARRAAAHGAAPGRCASASAGRSAAARPRWSPRCAGAARRAVARRRDQRHLHHRGRRVPAPRTACCPTSGSARSRPAAARTPRSATTSPPTSTPSRTSRRASARSTWSSSRAAATT